MHALLFVALAASPVPASIALPGSPQPVSMDYLGVELQPPRVWAPAGNTGKVDVIDVASGKVTSVDGFPTAERTTPRGTRTVGPSSVAIGTTSAFVGNRADSSVCAIDRKTLARQGCRTLSTSPDGVSFVPATNEIWITTPRARSLTIVPASDPKHLGEPVTIALEGNPEGYAVDAEHGLFFTNLEDADRTLVFDVRARKELRRLSPGCDADGPRGIALGADGVIFVACSDHVAALDVSGKNGVLGTLPTGRGLDNIDALPSSGLVAAAAGQAHLLTLAKWKGGKFEQLWQIESSPGVRAAVLAPDGSVFGADSANGRMLKVAPPQPQK